MNVGVYLPPKARSQELPVLYWLSGLTCNEQNFIPRSGMQRYAAEPTFCFARTPVREAVMSQMLTVEISGKVPGFT
ncbi:alpha/beta hydrolase-fold protein [Shigella sonnei]